MESALSTLDSARRCSVAVRVSDVCVSLTSAIDNSPENDLSYFSVLKITNLVHTKFMGFEDLSQNLNQIM